MKAISILDLQNLMFYAQVNGWTALFHLAAKGMVAQVQKLLTLGANPNIQDNVCY